MSQKFVSGKKSGGAWGLFFVSRGRVSGGIDFPITRLFNI